MKNPPPSFALNPEGILRSTQYFTRWLEDPKGGAA
jgi:hypothetical protein